jgi:starvation-inducible DNA-binding protein
MAKPTAKETAHELSKFLADSYMVYLKTQNFHWNVTGPQFFALHEMFEEQYTDLAIAVDDIAERIRALNEYAPGSFVAFRDLSDIEEATSVPTADQMVKELAKDNETLAQRCRSVLELLDGSGDEATIDLATERLRQHDLNAWMLRSSV